MPPKKDKKSVSDAASSTASAVEVLNACGPTGTSEMSTMRKDICDMLTDLKKDMNTKLDHVILNQQKLIDRITTVERNVTEMESSLTYTTNTVEELQQQVDNSKGTVTKMASLLDQTTKRLEEAENNILQLERYSRNFNLRFCGIPETLASNEPPADALEKVRQIIRDQFHLPDVKIENAHRIGNRNPDKPRHILVKFLCRPEKQAILTSAKKVLANTEIYVMQDLPLADLKKKHALKDVMKKAYVNHQRPAFRNGKLFIDGKEYRSG